MDEEIKQLKSVLRSLVVSSPTEVDMRSLLRDYRNMLGASIPFSKFGYRDPLTFLKERCNDCFLFQGQQINPVLTLIVPDTLKHIDKFVQKQKSTPAGKHKGKRRSIWESAVKPSCTSLESGLIAKTFELKEKNKQTSQLPDSIETLKQLKKKEQTSELRSAQAAVVSCTERQPEKKTVTPEPHSPSRRSQRATEKQSNEAESGIWDVESGRQTCCSDSSAKKTQLAKLKEDIKRIVYEHSDGVWCSEILRLYRERYSQELNFLRFGYTSLLSLVYLVEGVSVSAQARGGDWRVWPPGAPAPAPTAARLVTAPAAAAPPHRAAPPRAPPVDVDDALPGLEFESDVFPEDCVHFLESIPPLELDELRAGDMLEVVVGEVYSPSHFWLQRLGDQYNIAMHNIMDEMTEYYERGEGRNRQLACGALRAGHYCSSLYDGDWHRSVIVKVLDSDTVKVRHVDYGTVEPCAARALRPLRREWARLPAQAARARLAGARPPAAGRRWPRASAAAFLARVRDTSLVAELTGLHREERILEVALIDTSTEEDVCVAAELVRAGYADPRPPGAATSECYLYPRFPALEEGDTPNYAEIHAYLRDGVALDFLDEYRRHVPPCLPSPRASPPPSPAPSPSPSPPSPLPQLLDPPGTSFTPRLPRPRAAERAPPPRPAVPSAESADSGCDVASKPRRRRPREAPQPVPVPTPRGFPPSMFPGFPPPFYSPYPLPERAPPERGGVTIPASDCDIFHMLSNVDPGAAQRFMLGVLSHAHSSRLNSATEMRAPARRHDIRPPPGFDK